MVGVVVGVVVVVDDVVVVVVGAVVVAAAVAFTTCRLWRIAKREAPGLPPQSWQ